MQMQRRTMDETVMLSGRNEKLPESARGRSDRSERRISYSRIGSRSGNDERQTGSAIGIRRRSARHTGRRRKRGERPSV